MQRKDYTQRLICRTLHEDNSMVMRKLNEDGSKKRMFNHKKRLMRQEKQKYKSIKVLNGSGRPVSDEEEVEKSGEILVQIVCTNGKATLGEKREFGNGMTSGGLTFSQQEISVAIKKMKENKAVDKSGVITGYLERETMRYIGEVRTEIQKNEMNRINVLP